MLHLVTAWSTHERKGDPEVLYCGTDSAKATAIAKTPPHTSPPILRIERAFVPESFRQKFAQAQPPQQGPQAMECGASAPLSPRSKQAPASPEEAPAAPEASAPETTITADEDGAPQLL